MEAAFHALRQRFPYVSKIIVQSDNAKNLAGKQTKLLLPYVCSAAGLKLLAYYHNEAQSGKDVCDTHFSHQQTQVDTYLVQGDGGRKVSTPKQLAVALITNSVKNTTVLLVKPDFHAPCRTAVIPAIPGISGFYAVNYITTDGNPEVQFFHSLGQKVPSVTVPIPSCPACSLSTPMGSDGVNFTGVTVLLNSDSKGTCVQANKDRSRYARRHKGMSHREVQRLQKRRDDEEAMNEIQAAYPQCANCLYHFKSQKLLMNHMCGGVFTAKDVLSKAMKHADELLSRLDFTLEGAIDRASNMFDNAINYATFEPNFYAGWAHTRKDMHPELTSKVMTIIHQCWKAGESIDQGKVKISVDGVFARLDELQLQKVIRLSELPLPGKIRAVYQTIGCKTEAPSAVGKRGRPQKYGGPTGRQKKARITYGELDFEKSLSKWKKPELEVYLTHHKWLSQGTNQNSSSVSLIT